MSLRDFESVMKAAADPTRVRILKILESGEMCVCQVIAILSFGQSTVSKHLFLLRAAGLIKDRRDRKWVHYSLVRGGDSAYASKMLRNLRGWLNDDPVIAKDRERTAMARAIGPMAICERNMTLPARRHPAPERCLLVPGTGDPRPRNLVDGGAAHPFPMRRELRKESDGRGDRPLSCPPGSENLFRRIVPHSVHPLAIQVLKEIGIDISGHQSKGLDSIDAGSVDAVITLCAEEVCPVFLGNAHRIHWGLPDPASVYGTEETRLNAFRSVRDELRRRLKILF